MKSLDIGCGNNKEKDAIGIDFRSNTQADILHDLNDFPYPFEDNEFDEVYCRGVLEHLDDIFRTMNEIYRISKPGALVKIWVPHFSSCDSYGDPSHKRTFSARSFDYFTGNYPPLDFYTSVKFTKEKVEIEFWQIHKIGGLRIQNLFGVGLLANKLTSIYERFFAFILPAQLIYFELRAVK